MTLAHVNETKFASSENYRLAPVVTLSFWSFILNVNKNKAVLFGPDMKNKA
jgi:hypothetical protein